MHVFCLYSADERFDATFHTNVLVNATGSCQYIPPGEMLACSVCSISLPQWSHTTQVFMIVLTFNGNFPCLCQTFKLVILTSLCKLLVNLMYRFANSKATSKQPLTFNPREEGVDIWVEGHWGWKWQARGLEAWNFMDKVKGKVNFLVGFGEEGGQEFDRGR